MTAPPRTPWPRLRAAIESPRFVPACIGLFLALRLAILLVGPLSPTTDYLWYFNRAVGLARGQGYNEAGVLTAFWPVGWPATLSLIFRLTGPSVLAGQLADLGFALAGALLTLRLSTLWFTDRALARIAGRLALLMLAVLPNQIGYVPILSTEIFYQLLLVAGLCLLARERPLASLLAGLVFGVATLTKAQSLPIAGFVIIWVLLATPASTLPWRPGLARALRQGAVVYLVAVLVVAPWSWRNWQVLHAFIPVSTNGGWTLLTGNNQEANGDYVPAPGIAAGINHDPADQVAMDRLARARAIDWIAANPGRFVALMPKKFIRLWLPDGEAEWSFQSGYAGYDANQAWFRAVRWLNQGAYLLLLAGSLPTIWRLLRRLPRRAAPVPAQERPWAQSGLAVCVYFTLISMVFSGQSRFHFALMPLLALYAGATIARRLIR